MRGKKEKLRDSYEVAECYKQLANRNEMAADILYNQGVYQEAAYLYIQAMEKCVKEQICRKVDVTNRYFSDEMRKLGHSLDDSVMFLIKIYCSGNNCVMKEQITQNIVGKILKNIKFTWLHNNVRYPRYNLRTEEYSMLIIDKEDCTEIKKMNQDLKGYLSELYRI